MVTLRCDGCCSNPIIEEVSTTCYYVVTTNIFESKDFKGMPCPITQLPTEWVDVEDEE